jgi:hypothetical protein
MKSQNSHKKITKFNIYITKFSNFILNQKTKMETKVVKFEIGKLLAGVVVVLAIVAGAAAYLNSSYFKGLIILPKPITEESIVTRIAAVNTKLATNRDLQKNYSDLITAEKDQGAITIEAATIGKDALTIKVSSDTTAKISLLNSDLNAAKQALKYRKDTQMAKSDVFKAVTAVTMEQLTSDTGIVTSTKGKINSDMAFAVKSNYALGLKSDAITDLEAISAGLSIKIEAVGLNARVVNTDSDLDALLSDAETISGHITTTTNLTGEMRTSLGSDLDTIETAKIDELQMKKLDQPAPSVAETPTIKDENEVRCAADLIYDAEKNMCCDVAGVCS